AEMLQMMGEFLQPIVVDDDSLALDAIAEVGPGGHFFGAQHTLAHYETAFYAPIVSDWRNFETWREAGAVDAAHKANAIWKQLLAEFQPPALDPAINEALKEFIAKRKGQGGVLAAYPMNPMRAFAVVRLGGFWRWVPRSIRWLAVLALMALPLGAVSAKSYTMPPEVGSALQSLMKIAPGDCPDEAALDPAVGTISGFLDQQDGALADFVHSMPDAMLWHAAAVWRQGDLARAERELAAWLAGAPAEHESRGTAESDLKLIRHERDLAALKIGRPQAQLQLAAVWQEESTSDHRRVAVIW